MSRKSWIATVEMSFSVDVIIHGNDEDDACVNAESYVDDLANNISIDLECGCDNSVLNCRYGVRAIDASFMEEEKEEE